MSLVMCALRTVVDSWRKQWRKRCHNSFFGSVMAQTTAPPLATSTEHRPFCGALTSVDTRHRMSCAPPRDMHSSPALKHTSWLQLAHLRISLSPEASRVSRANQHGVHCADGLLICSALATRDELSRRCGMEGLYGQLGAAGPKMEALQMQMQGQGCQLPELLRKAM
jgi:hypothetical protein